MFTSPTGRMQPIWSFVLSVFFSAVALVACNYIANALAGDHTLRFELIFRSLLAVALFGLYIWLLAVADQTEDHRAWKLGFPTAPGWRRQLVGGALLGLALTVLAIVPLLIWANVSVNISLTSRGVFRLAGVIIILVVGALAEELMFRGYPFQRLAEAIGPVYAICVFSVLFGAVHLMNPGATPLGLINTVLIGVVLAIAYLRTSALWLPWGLHFGWNASLGLLFGLPVSGLRIFNVVTRTNVTGPRWLTGSSYGLEASVPGAVAVVVGLAVVCAWPMARIGDAITISRQLSEPLDEISGIQE